MHPVRGHAAQEIFFHIDDPGRHGNGDQAGRFAGLDDEIRKQIQALMAEAQSSNRRASHGPAGVDGDLNP